MRIQLTKIAMAAILIAAYGVWALDGVTYIDANGITQTANNVTVISSDGGARTLTAGWYTLQGTFTNSGEITISGTVHLILANSSNVTVNSGITVYSYGNSSSLSIYAQSTGSTMGKLTAIGVSVLSTSSGIIVFGGGTLTINGGTVTAIGGDGGSYGGAGIGNYYHDSYGNNTVTINGGTVTATGGSGVYGGAGIGGDGSINNCGTVTITGGTVTATGSNRAAGIGGNGYPGTGGTVTISGGTVTATGNGGAGIGGGAYRSDIAGTFTLNGNAVVFASSIGDTQTSRRTRGILFIDNAGTFYGTSVTLEKNVTIPSSHTLTIPANAAFTIPSGITLANNGTVTPANNSKVTVAGTVSGNKIVGANSSTPTLASKTATSITANAANLLASTGQDVEYAINTANAVPSSGWQTETIFTGLTENTTYRIFARSKADSYFAAGTASAGLQATTKAIPKAANFTIPANHIYTGNARGFDISIAGMGAATVYYDGSTEKPTNAGTYAVTVDVADGTEFTEAAGIALGNYTIAKKSVTITGLLANDKEYDGTTTVSVSGTAAVSGKVGDDDVTAILGAASFANKNAGTGKAVTFASIAIEGDDAYNYVLAAQPTSIAANITAKPVTITGAAASDKIYNGNTVAAVAGTPEVSGKIGDDDVSVANGTASFADKNVGTDKTVTFASFSLGGVDKGNYALSAQPASVAASIAAKPITIAGVTANSRQYNGTAEVSLSGGMLNGVASGDVVGFTLGTGTVATPDAGSSKAVATNIVLTGTGAGNYTLAQPADIAASIAAKPVTITGVTATNKEYDGTTTVELAGGVLNGVVEGDAISFTLGTGTVATPDAGSSKAVATNIVLTGTGAGNYTLAQPANITVAITDPTPIFTNRENPYIGGIVVQTTSNAIQLSNIPQGAKVEVYSLQGKRVYSAHSGNSQILRIQVQTKGMYVVKAGSQSVRAVVR